MSPTPSSLEPAKLRTFRTSYLDANAGIPFEGISAFESIDLGANPSSVHARGRQAKRVLSEARENIAASLGKNIDPESLFFTSSGSEANQTVIQSYLQMTPTGRGWALTTGEHDSVRMMIGRAEALGMVVCEIGIDSNGIVDRIEEVLSSGKIGLLSVLWVNNETGVIQPLSQIIDVARRYDVWVHVDAAQAWGKLAFDVSELGAHWVTFSGPKVGAWPGVGVVWKQRGAPPVQLILGKQELGRRGGTENVPGIHVLGMVARALDPVQFETQLRPVRDQIESLILETIPDTQINGREAPRIGNTSSVSFEGISGDSLVLAMDMRGYCLSVGAACTSGAIHPSHVLKAMGRNDAQALATLRISLWHAHRDFDPKPFVQTLSEVIRQLREAKKNHV